MPWPSDSVLTLQPHPYGEAAFEKVGVRVMSIWWRRGELNPVLLSFMQLFDLHKGLITLKKSVFQHKNENYGFVKSK